MKKSIDISSNVMLYEIDDKGGFKDAYGVHPECYILESDAVKLNNSTVGKHIYSKYGKYLGVVRTSPKTSHLPEFDTLGNLAFTYAKIGAEK